MGEVLDVIVLVVLHRGWLLYGTISDGGYACTVRATDRLVTLRPLFLERESFDISLFKIFGLSYLGIHGLATQRCISAMLSFIPFLTEWGLSASRML